MAKIRTVNPAQLSSIANSLSAHSLHQDIGLNNFKTAKAFPVGSSRRNEFMSSAAYHLNAAYENADSVVRQHFSGPGQEMPRPDIIDPGMN